MIIPLITTIFPLPVLETVSNKRFRPGSCFEDVYRLYSGGFQKLRFFRDLGFGHLFLLLFLVDNVKQIEEESYQLYRRRAKPQSYVTS